MNKNKPVPREIAEFLAKPENQAFEIVLRKFGYRRIHPTIWAKPVGYMCLMFNIGKGGIFENWFKDIKGEISLWEAYTFVPEEHGAFPDWLKEKESEAHTTFVGNRNSKFETCFDTFEEFVEFEL